MLGIHLINGSNEAAHIEDTVSLVGSTMNKLFANGNLTAISNTPDSCKKRADNPGKWEDGRTILE